MEIATKRFRRKQMLTKPIPEIFRGPLGSHRNYISYVALPNCVEYFSCKKLNEEQGRSSTPVKYGEFRLFLNAVESLNNILDYLHSEHKNRARKKEVGSFRKAVNAKFPALGELSDLANAYKHCGRYDDGKNWKRATDLQKTHTHVKVHISLSNPSASRADAYYEFSGPLPEHDTVLNDAFKFWLDYHNHPKMDDLINI
jgi:hypothetical protein